MRPTQSLLAVMLATSLALPLGMGLAPNGLPGNPTGQGEPRFPPDSPEECIVSPSQPPPGGRQCDPWVDALGDDVFGNINMQDNFLVFRDVPFGSPGNGSLAFGNATVCLDSGNCNVSQIIVEETVVVNGTVTIRETITVGGNAAVGTEQEDDDDFVFFDDGASEFLAWREADQAFQFSSDLLVGGAPGPAAAGHGGPHSIFFGDQAHWLRFDPGDARFDFSHDVAGLVPSDQFCAQDHYVQGVQASGLVQCAADQDSGGTLTQIDTGDGLTGGPINSNGTISIAEGGVTQTMLAFAPATQTELEAHKTSGDHDAQYAQLNHFHEKAFEPRASPLSVPGDGTAIIVDTITLDATNLEATCDGFFPLVEFLVRADGYGQKTGGSGTAVGRIALSFGTTMNTGASLRTFRLDAGIDDDYQSFSTSATFAVFPGFTDEVHLVADSTNVEDYEVGRSSLTAEPIGSICSVGA